MDLCWMCAGVDSQSCAVCQGAGTQAQHAGQHPSHRPREPKKAFSQMVAEVPKKTEDPAPAAKTSAKSAKTSEKQAQAARRLDAHMAALEKMMAEQSADKPELGKRWEAPGYPAVTAPWVPPAPPAPAPVPAAQPAPAGSAMLANLHFHLRKHAGQAEGMESKETRHKEPEPCPSLESVLDEIDAGDDCTFEELGRTATAPAPVKPCDQLSALIQQTTSLDAESLKPNHAVPSTSSQFASRPAKWRRPKGRFGV
ncbi:unnamed protein product [Effrenium voratum]|nr:unnamed protein product [Effrenium voratum]